MRKKRFGNVLNVTEKEKRIKGGEIFLVTLLMIIRTICKKSNKPRTHPAKLGLINF